MSCGPTPPPARPAAIIPAGGRARRLGGTPKPLLRDAAGTPLLTGLLLGLLDLGLAADEIVVVGPPEHIDPALEAGGARLDHVRRTRERPAFGGPAAAVAAGLEALCRRGNTPELVLTLGADMPRAVRAVPVLLEAADRRPTSEVWIGRTGDDPGRLEHLVALHRTETLGRRLTEVDPDGLPLHRLLEGLATTQVPLPDGAADDVDTWEAAAAFGLSAPLGSASPEKDSAGNPGEPSDHT